MSHFYTFVIYLGQLKSFVFWKHLNAPDISPHIIELSGTVDNYVSRLPAFGQFEHYAKVIFIRL